MLNQRIQEAIITHGSYEPEISHYIPPKSFLYTISEIFICCEGFIFFKGNALSEAVVNSLSRCKNQCLFSKVEKSKTLISNLITVHSASLQTKVVTEASFF